MDDVHGTLTLWYFQNAFDNGFFGLKPRKRWRWPTMEEVRQETGMDEDEILAEIENFNENWGEKIILRNGKVGLTENPTNQDTSGRKIYNPNSGF